jgi:hypothetical protein
MEKNKKTLTVFLLTLLTLSIPCVPLCLFAQEGGKPQEETSQNPQLEYKSEGLKDPFKLPFKKEESAVELKKEAVAEQPLPALTIEGIIWGGRFPQAIINNQVVKTGDTIEGVRIKAIAREGLSVVFNNRAYELSSPGKTTLGEAMPETKRRQ